MFEGGRVHEKSDLREAFHKRHTREFGEESGALPSSKKLKLGLAKMQFPAVLRGLLALFSIFLFDILSRSQLFPTPTPPSLFLCGFWTNYETHIFKKWEAPTPGPPPRGSASEKNDYARVHITAVVRLRIISFSKLNYNSIYRTISTGFSV